MSIHKFFYSLTYVYVTYIQLKNYRSHQVCFHLLLCRIFLQRELDRLRKECSDLLAQEQAHVNELLRQQKAEKDMIGSFKLKVKWKGDGVYDKDNLKSLFSKVN